VNTISNGTEAAPRARRRWSELSLNIGAIAGVVCILLAAASVVFGLTPLVFRSGSMAPAIGTGSLAVAKTVPTDKIEVGDVISVEDQTGTSITHRVVDLTPVGDGTSQVVLRGDANSVVDPQPYTITEAKRVWFHIPKLGYVVAWLSSGIALFLGGLLAGALLMLAFGPAGRRPGAARRTPGDGQERVEETTSADEVDRSTMTDRTRSAAEENSHV